MHVSIIRHDFIPHTLHFEMIYEVLQTTASHHVVVTGASVDWLAVPLPW
jgi:hypothetical protein